jgi:hypothetical protein
MRHAPEQEFERRQDDFLEGFSAPVIDPEGDIKGEQIEPEQASDRPEAQHDEGNARPDRGQTA